MLVLGLDKFVEDLTEISGRAAKEFSLEKGVYGILVQTDFCFTTADTWLHYD